MNNKIFKSGEIAIYSRDSNEEIIVIVLRKIFQDDSGVKYFKCLINNRLDTCCEVWLEKL